MEKWVESLQKTGNYSDSQPIFGIRFASKAPHYTALLWSHYLSFEKHQITTTSEGFVFQDKTYESLSHIVRSLTDKGLTCSNLLQNSKTELGTGLRLWASSILYRYTKMVVAYWNKKVERSLEFFHTELWNCECFYGKASNAEIKTALAKNGNPNIYCLRFSNEPGCLVLYISKSKLQDHEMRKVYFKNNSLNISFFGASGPVSTFPSLNHLFSFLHEEHGLEPFRIEQYLCAWGLVQPPILNVDQDFNDKGFIDRDSALQLGRKILENSHFTDFDLLNEVLGSEKVIRCASH